MRPQVVTMGPAAASSASVLIRFDEYAPPGPVAVQVVTSGTVTYNINGSLDDPNSPTNPVAAASMTWTSLISGASGSSTSVSFAVAPLFAQLFMAGGTGTVTATFIQQGIAPY